MPTPAPARTRPHHLGVGMGLPATHAEVGSAARKVGGSVLSGMRTLGGLVLSAATSRAATDAGKRDTWGVAWLFLRDAPEREAEDEVRTDPHTLAVEEGEMEQHRR